MSYLFRSRSSPHPSRKEDRSSAAFMEAGLVHDHQLADHHDLPVHPRLWLALGVLYISLGLVQLALAASWRWWFGVAVGLGIIKTGSSLAGLGYTGGRQVRSDPATLLGRLGRLLLRIVLWGSAKVQQLLWRLRWLIYANGMFVALLIAIHWASPDPHLASFPAACPPGTRFGCSRVTEAAPHGARRLRPLALPGSVEGVQGAARGWVEQQTHARVLLEQPGFLHARFVSFFWGFADDFIVGVRCVNATHALVEVQGQLRIGKSDLGVNRRRNKRFLQALAADAAAGIIPQEPCGSGGSGGGQEGGGGGQPGTPRAEAAAGQEERAGSGSGEGVAGAGAGAGSGKGR